MNTADYRKPTELSRQDFSLAALKLIDAPTLESFDSLTRTAARLLRTPVALLSIVEEEKDRQFFTSQQGLAEPWAQSRQTPLSHSFCQHVKTSGKPLIVSDAREHPKVCDNLAIRDLNVVAYLGVPVAGPDGSPLGALCVIEPEVREWSEEDVEALTDVAKCVNDAILLRATLLASEIRQQRLDLTIQASGDGIWDWNIETGELFWSDALMRMVGMEPADFYPHYESFEERLDPNDRERVARALDEHFSKRTPFHLRFRMWHSQGHLVDVSAKGQAAWNDEGTPVRMVGTISDVSELVHSNDLLLKTERLASIGHWHLTIPQHELTWSPETYRIQGFEPFAFCPSLEEAINCYHPDDRAVVETAVSNAIETGKPLEFDARIVRPSGEVRHVHCEGEVSTDCSGEANALFGSIQDRTDHIERERQLNQAQKMEAFGQLAGGVAHDFNNLMAVIMGNIELLQEENDPFVRSELTGAALDAVLRGKDLTGSLLNFARKAPLRPRHILLKEMFANLEKIIHRTLPAHQDVVFDIPDTLWPIEADPSMLESCILNLVLNARDAMPNGGILKISARQINCRNAATEEHKDLRPGVYVVIEVSDTGEGIAEKDLPRVFEPFFTTKPVGKGSGLGLARVRGFAKQSGGDVQIKSKASRGTSIRMALPASVTDVNSTERSGQKYDTSMARILLVEDMEDVRKVMERRLKADGYEVVSARLGDEALEIFHHDKNFDVMITDVVMPGKLQGAELALKIKAAKPEIGIIHMSGYTRGGLENLGIATSEILLKKPVAKSDLYAALNQVLNRRNFQEKLHFQVD